MKRLPENLLNSLEGVTGFDRASFVQVHESGQQVTSIRMNPAKLSIVNGEWSIGNNKVNEGESSNNSLLTIHEKIPWTQYGFYLKQRPSFTFDPFFHAGLYYVQESSSMFLEQAIIQLADLTKPLKVLDLCAAPGGKSTHIQSLISPDSLLVSNETIRARSNVLTDNLIKWGTSNVIVSNNDPSAFQKLESFFDLMVVDAPCSGSGLFRRDEDAIDEWSLNNVQLCSQRQKRILADALPALREDGILVYSTCSYSQEEDEDIADWLMDEFGMESCLLKIESGWQIIESVSPKNRASCYRFYPDKLMGEGFFLACFRKKYASKKSKINSAKPEKVSSREVFLIQPWLSSTGYEIMKENNFYFALQENLASLYYILRSALNIRYRGVQLGAIMKEKLVPDHALALSNLVSEQIPVNELNYDQSIKYLQKQEMNFNSSGKGFQLVSYKGEQLGWINVLPGRVNNYYPKEIRILKQSNDASFEK